MLALLFSVPTSVVPAAFELALVSTGKFCSALAPASASPASLAVTPAVPRLMPSWVFEWIVLPRTEWPLPLTTLTPLRKLNAIRLPAPAAVPPITLPVEEPWISMPSSERWPRLSVPVASVPI